MRKIDEKPQAPAVCVYCGKPGVTAEHIFGKWLSKKFPSARRNNLKVDALLTNVGDSAYIKPHPPKSKQGHPLGVFSRRVCRHCNAGWLSQIQNSVRPVIEKFLSQEPFRLSLEEINVLRAWLVNIVLLSDLSAGRNSTTYVDDFSEFYRTRTAPIHWNISVGRYQGDAWSEARQHHSGVAILYGGPPKSHVTGTQFVFVCVIDCIFFVVQGARGRVFPVFEMSDQARYLKTIWPSGEVFLDWPTTFISNDQVLDFFKEILVKQYTRLASMIPRIED